MKTKHRTFENMSCRSMKNLDSGVSFFGLACSLFVINNIADAIKMLIHWNDSDVIAQYGYNKPVAVLITLVFTIILGKLHLDLRSRIDAMEIVDAIKHVNKSLEAAKEYDMIKEDALETIADIESRAKSKKTKTEAICTPHGIEIISVDGVAVTELGENKAEEDSCDGRF